MKRCAAPGCVETCEGGTTVLVAGSEVALCATHAGQVRAGVTRAAVELVDALEQRMPGVTGLALRGFRVWRAWRAPLDVELEEKVATGAREVIEVEVIDVTEESKP